jgi:hypothetical protein
MNLRNSYKQKRRLEHVYQSLEAIEFIATPKEKA